MCEVRCGIGYKGSVWEDTVFSNDFVKKDKVESLYPDLRLRFSMRSMYDGRFHCLVHTPRANFYTFSSLFMSLMCSGLHTDRSNIFQVWSHHGCIELN